MLAINAIMFGVELAAGLLASSTALLSDSLDNLGDAITYALSLFVVWRSNEAKARVALLKGGLILFAALAIIAQIAYRLVNPTIPLFGDGHRRRAGARCKRPVPVSALESPGGGRQHVFRLGVPGHSAGVGRSGPDCRQRQGAAAYTNQTRNAQSPRQPAFYRASLVRMPPVRRELGGSSRRMETTSAANAKI